MSKLTAEQREQLSERLADHDAAVAPLRKWVEPILATLRLADQMRNGILESYGIADEILECEGCNALIIPGDKYAPGEITVCEECAPTRGDCLTQMKERLSDPEDRANMDEDDAANLAEDIAALEALASDELGKKAVHEYSP